MHKQNIIAIAGVLVALFLSVGCSDRTEKVIDIDGNSYKKIQIGSMTWTGSNCEVTHYRNGDLIPEVKDPKAWSTMTTGAWCYNDNKPENGKVYGRLYNWYAVTDPRGFAPQGWHVSTDAEWTMLGNLLGGPEKAGGALKTSTLWRQINSGATNSSGFTAFPAGGRRDNDGTFMQPGEYTRFWTSTESAEKKAWCRSIGYFDAALRQGEANKNIGFSVRCVKDTH